MHKTPQRSLISIQSFSGIDDEQFKLLLNSFKCRKNSQVEEFLKKDAQKYEKSNISRTFLLFDDKNGLFSTNNMLKLLGYFTVALKILEIPEDITKSQKRKICGFKFSEMDKIPTYLIGQLGKNDVFASEINGKELLFWAESIIKIAYNYVAGRVILLECEDNNKLVNFYEENGYVRLPKSENDPSELLQLVKKIQ